MSETFHVSIRLNLRAAAGAAFVDHVGPLATEAGLSFRNDVPGLIEGRGVTLMQLGQLLMMLGEVPAASLGSPGLVESGLVDDVWVHVVRER